MISRASLDTKRRKGSSVVLDINEARESKMVFKSFSLCGIEVPELYLSKAEIEKYRSILLGEDLIGPEDCILDHMKCDFFKQAFHCIVWENMKPNEAEFARKVA